MSKRIKTKYPGVFYIDSSVPGTNKPEKIYYIRYRKKGKLVEEKAGRQFQDDMTPAKASGIRSRKIEGNLPTNNEKRIQQAEELNKWTVNRLWEEYKKNKPNLKGIVTDENRFNKHLKGIFGEKEPYEIMPLDVERLKRSLLKRRKPATVKNILELLRRIVNYGVQLDLCKGLGFKIIMPTLNNEKTEDLTPEQLNSLLNTMNNDINQKAAKLMKTVLYTGMRRGELFRLKWEDIDFIKNKIYINDPKGGKNEIIPLNEPTKKLFRSIIRTKSEYVFPGKDGKQLTDIKKPVNRIKKKAGLPDDFRPLHGLRHFYASMLASSGAVDLYTLQKLLTHKSPKMTQRYAHLRDETLKNASDLAGTIIEDADYEK